MKNTIAKQNKNVKATSHTYSLLVKAETAEKILDAARAQWRMMKVEHKQARKAFKQAKKAAKYARKEAKASAKDLRRHGLKLPKPLKPASLAKLLPPRNGKKSAAKPVSAKRNGHSAVPPNAEQRTVPAPVPIQA